MSSHEARGSAQGGSDARTARDRAPVAAACFVYAVMFSASGFNQPYLPVWLAERRFTLAEIAVVVSAPMLPRVFVAPVFGTIADRTRSRGTVVRVLALAVFVLALVLWHAQGFWPILLLATAMMLLSQSIAPILDASVVSLVRHGIARDFGRMRLWGSASFAATSVVGGLVLGRGGPDAVFGSFVAATGCLILASFLLPSPPGASSVPNAGIGAALRLLRQPRLLIVLASAALVLASHATFNSYGSLQLIASGYPDWSVGMLWALATTSEIAMFWAGPLVARVLSPYMVLLLAAGVGVVRWSLMALELGLPLMMLLQLLHAATFSGSYLGMMRFVQRDVPDHFGARVQSAFVTMLGLTMALTTLAMGPLYQRLGSGAFQVTALLPLASLGLLLAFRGSLTTAADGAATLTKGRRPS